VLAGLLEQFQVTADAPVVVEVLPGADLFSARVSGLPGLDLDAACLGPVVVLRAPGAAEYAFNWHDALVHELTHAVCYLAAEGRVPQWLEEGLAFWAEGAARPRSRNLVLVHAYRSEKLLSLAELDRAFVAEPGSAQRSLAHAQSALAVEFLVERFGWEKLRLLLREAKGSARWADAVTTTFGMSLEELEARYGEYLNGRGRELRAQMALAATLGQQLEKGEALTEASTAALIRLLRDEPGAFETSVVRQVAERSADGTLGQEALWALVRLERTDVDSAVALARRLRGSPRLEEAKQLYRTALGASLEDPRAHVGLAGLALEAGEQEAAAQEAELAWGYLEGRRSGLRVAARGQAWQGLSEVFAALGDEERARQAGLRGRSLIGTDEAGAAEEGTPWAQ